jgi:hypothetical protein
LCRIAGSVETQFPDRIEKFIAADIHNRAPDQSSKVATSDLRAKSHLNDGVLRDLEEIGRPPRDPVEK